MGLTEIDAAAAHWSAREGLSPGRDHWWEHPGIVRHVNRLICGDPVAGIAGGDVALLGPRAPETGVSIGCGHGSKEMALLSNGAVQHFDLYEIADARVERGRAEADRRGLAERITWHTDLVDFTSPLETDLVYWSSALHHMLDTEQAIAWSRASLAPGGTFYMSEYVGPNRFQWAAEDLEAANRVRALLPDRLLASAPRELQRPSSRGIAAYDPTECADSAAILPAVRHHFPDATVTPTGGLVYHLALKGTLKNFGPEDETLLSALLLLDAAYAQWGMSHRAMAISPPTR